MKGGTGKEDDGGERRQQLMKERKGGDEEKKRKVDGERRTLSLCCSLFIIRTNQESVRVFVCMCVMQRHV